MQDNFENDKACSLEYKTYGKLHWTALILFLAGSVIAMNMNLRDLTTSVLSPLQQDPFDGTVMPVLKAPIWTSLTSSEYDLDYEHIPANKMGPLLPYDPDVLKTSVSNLGWTSSQDLNIRNAKITYSVPYMGNYELDGVEGAGSHLAVDFKLPMGTPVYAIANGIVVKVNRQNTGFGNHIVIKHEGFPSLENPNAKDTYFSSYSHLSEISVSEGSKISKGKWIGKTGESGTATTPHLHFQIDNDQAAWHPYWPFTFQEASVAGYSFVEAVNEGLGAEKALKTTVNPMKYVQKYLTASAVNGDNAAVETVPVITPETEPVVMPEPPVETIEVLEEAPAEPLVEDSPVEDVPVESVDLPPDSGEIVTEAENEAVIDEESSDTDVAIFSDVSSDDKTYKAIYFLKKYGVVSGYPDGSFGSSNEVSRAEALKIILGAVKADLVTTDPPFKDIPTQEWFSKYVATAYDREIIAGYADGTFKPANVVNRAELLKILLESFGVNVNMKVTEDVYSDVPANAWYAPYVAYAKAKNLIMLEAGLFKPDEGMTRREVAETVYRILMFKLGGVRKYSSGIEISKEDLEAYFG